MNSVDDRRKYLILKDPNIKKGLFILALPVMLNNLLRTFHDLVDAFFVGRIEGFGEQSISAISATFPINFMYIALGMGLSIAGTALISQFYGSGQLEESRRYSTYLTMISLILGLVLMVFSYFMAPFIMRWMGTEGYTYDNSVAYLQIRAFELPFLMLFFAFTAMRQSSGDTTTPVILGVVAMVINMILSPVLIEIYNLGVSGAAFATLVANVLIMPIGIGLMFKSKTGITISMRYTKLEARATKRIVATALPASFGQAFTAIGFAFLTAFILDYGDATYAAFSVGNRISSIFLHPVMAIGGVMASYIGQNIGNLNPDRAKRTYREGLILSIVIMTVLACVGLLLRRPLTGLFLDVGEESYNLSITYMFFLFIGLPLMAIYTALTGVYNGTGNTIYTMAIGIIRLWAIRIPLIMAFGAFTNLGSSGIWYAMLISNMVIAVIGYMLLSLIDYKPTVNLEPELT